MAGWREANKLGSAKQWSARSGVKAALPDEQDLTLKGRARCARAGAKAAGPKRPRRGAAEWALQDLNLRPTDYESAALTN